MPTEEEIREIFNKNGQNQPEQELNWWSLVLSDLPRKSDCRLPKKAELNMCIPYLFDRRYRCPSGYGDLAEYHYRIDGDLKILNACGHGKYFGIKRKEMKDACWENSMDTEDVKRGIRTHNNICHGRKCFIRT